MATKKSTESAYKAEEAPGTDVAASKKHVKKDPPNTMSEALKGPTTADLNPAYVDPES